MTNGVNPNGAGSSTQLDPHAMSLIQYQEYLERCHTAYTTAANAANELRQHPNFDRYHAYLEQESKALLQLMVGRDLVEEVTQSAGTSTTSRAAPPSLETAIEDCRKALSARVDQATRMPEPPAGIHTVPGLAPLWNVFRHFRDIKLKLVEEMETTLNAFENLVHLSPSQRVQNLQAVFHHLEFRPGHHLTHFEFLEVEYERHWPSLVRRSLLCLIST